MFESGGLEEYRPTNILHEFHERTLYLEREIPTERMIVLIKITVSAEANLRTHRRITTFCGIFLQASLCQKYCNDVL